VALGPEIVEVRVYQTVLFVRMGDVDRVFQLNAKALELDPNAPLTDYHSGMGHLLSGDFEEAVKYLETARSKTPNQIGLRLHLASAYMEVDRRAEAEKEIEAILDVSPDYSVTWADKVFPYRLDQNNHRFIENLRKAGLPEGDEKSSAQDNPTLALPDKPSIAVLPFDNLSGDPQQEYFADGIAEDIITGLSRFHWFFVIARNSSFTFKGQAVDVTQVSQQLGVQYVLEGSVRKAGNRIRINAQLIDATTGRHVWADRYDRELDDIFVIQDEITAAIIGAVAPSFVTAEERRTERRLPANLGAWDYVMQGNASLWRGGKEDIGKARDLFQRALDLDAGNATALSGLAMAHIRRRTFGWTDDPRQAEKQAYEAARRAVSEEGDNAWAHAALGWISSVRRDSDAGIRSCSRALELNPNLAFAEGALATCYAHSGDADNAIFHADKADRLSPRDPARGLWTIARSWASFIQGDVAKAAEWARWITEANPEFPAGWRHLAAFCGLLDRKDEAAFAVGELLRRMPNVTVSNSRDVVPGNNADILEKFVDGLRKAGVPA
jgi:TolB-like protein/Flp pilus assembly protein TadD